MAGSPNRPKRTMKMLTWIAAAVLGGGVLAAAPAHAQNAPATPPARRARQERNRIRADEIQQSNANTVYQLIQSRRGMWLMRNQPTDMSGTGSGQMLVFMDGAQLDGMDDLKQLPLAGVRIVEFLTPAEAEHKLGKYTVVGAIRVLTRDETPADSARSAHR